MTTADLAVDALATFRLTRLVVEDTFPLARSARSYVTSRFPPNGTWLDDSWQVTEAGDGALTAHKWVSVAGCFTRVEVPVQRMPTSAVVVSKAHPLGELISCPWCVSVYVGLGVVAARRIAPKAWGALAKALAGSAAAGFLSTH